MGGFGSGRREYARTPTVEECRQLNINQFTDAVDHPGLGTTVHWGDPDDPAASITVVLLSEDHVDAAKSGEGLEASPVEDADNKVYVVDDGEHETDSGDASDGSERATAVYLTYTITDSRTGESREVSTHVPLEYTECNFGGVRPWFRCPGVVNGTPCDERVGKLYKPPGEDLFLCRECHDLGYATSRASGDDLKTAELRYRRAFAKADAEDRRPHPSSEPYLPTRPKGMHQETFRDLMNRVQAARREWNIAMEEDLQSLAEKYDITLPSLT